METGRSHALWTRLALLGASVLVALLLAEGMVRFLGLSPGRCEPEPPAPVVIGDPFHYRLPGSYRGELACPRSAWNRPGFSVPLETNPSGFRERPFPAGPPTPGAHRVLVLGDSFAMGFGVRADEALPARLEAHLNSARPEKRHEVYNLGIWGMNTVMEANTCEVWGLPMEPDLVVVVHVMNDAEPEPGQIEEDAPAPPDAGDPPGLLRRVAAGAWDRAVRWSRFARTLHDVWRWQIMGQERANMTTHNGRLVRDYNAFYAEGSPGWDLVQEGLDRLAVMSREQGFSVVVALFPMMIDLSGDYPYESSHRKVAAAARRRGLAVVDLRPAFSGFEGRELWVTATDNHPDARAHDLAAAYLARTLASGRETGADGPLPAP